MNQVISEFKKNGYFVVKSILNNDEIINLKKFISKLTPKLLVPYSNEAWGYGNCLDKNEFKIISKNKIILDHISKILCDTFEFNHLMVNRKPPWIGPEVEYHQEVFNSKTFAPGVSVNDLENKWCQIYIPLEDESANNGGLRIVTNTHSLGMLDSEDIINQNYSHKRRVPVDVLNNITKSNQHNLIDLNLKAGDFVFFSPLLVHGSPSNWSQYERISLVLQSKVTKVKTDDKIFDEEVLFRTNFIIKSLSKKISEIDKDRKYSDFKSKK